MQKPLIFFLISLISFTSAKLSAQESTRLGIRMSPGYSWLQTNDTGIDTQGGNLSFSIGIQGDYYWQDNVSLIGGLLLNLNQGGRLIYEEGGNFFPKSDLSNPKLNSGDKPLPDGVDIRYSFNTLEVPFGLKLKTQQLGNFTYYAEFPIFALGLVTSAKADITGTDIAAEDEDIGRDFRNAYLAWQLGLGAEYETVDGTIFTAGLHFHRSITDMTRDKGVTVDAAGDKSREKSRASFGNVWLSMGILF